MLHVRRHGKTMARPIDPRPRRQYLINLRLIVGEDDDLIAVLEPSPNRASLVKAALRGASVGGRDMVLVDVLVDEDDIEALGAMMF